MSARDPSDHAVRRARWRVLALWLVVLAVGTAAMLPFRDRLDKAHVALLLMLVPLGGSAAGGRSVGLGLATASFLVFNWFFLPPYHTLVVADPLDWLVLLAFLTTSAVAAQLLYAAQEEARVARLRTAEVDRLRVVGAEAVTAGRAEDALNTVAEVIRDAAQADSCELLAEGDGGAPHIMAAAGVAAGASASPHADAEGDIVRPLSVRGRIVGSMRLRSARGLSLDAERSRFVDALSYYAALGIERVRLIAAVERAEALREADELKDALLASVSHDLRTPLTTIKARAHEMRIHGD